jgi:hypothetical protein
MAVQLPRTKRMRQTYANSDSLTGILAAPIQQKKTYLVD